MFEVNVKHEVAEAQKGLSDLQRSQLPFAIAVALTRTAWKAAAAEKDEIRRIFNQPVPWTVESIYVQKATKANPVAKVRFKDERTTAGFYLLPHVRGGARRHTPFEGRLIQHGIMRQDQWAIPAVGADRDAAGNLNPGQLMKILSDLNTVDTARRYPGARNRGVYRTHTYFAAGLYRVARTAHLKPGIYRRIAGFSELVPVFVFTSSRPVYRATFAFEDVARRTRNAEFKGELVKALADAVRTSNSRGKWRIK